MRLVLQQPCGHQKAWVLTPQWDTPPTWAHALPLPDHSPLCIMDLQPDSRRSCRSGAGREVATAHPASTTVGNREWQRQRLNTLPRSRYTHGDGGRGTAHVALLKDPAGKSARSLSLRGGGAQPWWQRICPGMEGGRPKGVGSFDLKDGLRKKQGHSAEKGVLTEGQSHSPGEGETRGEQGGPPGPEAIARSRWGQALLGFTCT